MTVEVRTCFADSLLIYSVACLLEWDSEIYVTDICRIDLKILSSQMQRLKLLLLILDRNNHTNSSCSWQPREVQVSTPDFFRELTAFMTVVNIAAM